MLVLVFGMSNLTLSHLWMGPCWILLFLESVVGKIERSAVFGDNPYHLFLCRGKRSSSRHSLGIRPKVAGESSLVQTL